MSGCTAERGDLASYVVGSLPADERAAVERHVAACPGCRAELAQLDGLVPFLAVLTPEEAERGPAQASGAILDGLLATVAAERRRRVLRRRLVAVLAAAAVLVAGVLGGLAVVRGDDEPRATTTATGSNDSGVRIDLSMAEMAWGTALKIKVANVSPGHTCSLVAVGREGVRETAATWTVPSGGYLGDDGLRSLTVDGAVGLGLEQIDRFEVVTPEGERLVTVGLD